MFKKIDFKKRIFFRSATLIIAILIMFNALPVQSFASSNYHVSERNIHFSGGAEIEGTNMPTDTWNLVDRGAYNFGGLANVSDLYTEYFLTGKTTMTITVTNDSTSNVLTYGLYRKAAIGSSLVGTREVQPGDNHNWIVSDLVADNKYFIKFFAPSNFHGSVR